MWYLPSCMGMRDPNKPRYTEGSLSNHQYCTVCSPKVCPPIPPSSSSLPDYLLWHDGVHPKGCAHHLSWLIFVPSGIAASGRCLPVRAEQRSQPIEYARYTQPWAREKYKNLGELGSFSLTLWCFKHKNPDRQNRVNGNCTYQIILFGILMSCCYSIGSLMYTTWHMTLFFPSTALVLPMAAAKVGGI